VFDWWQPRLRSLKIEVHALWLAYRDPRAPWYGKVVAACVLAYALSPIDLIPDFIPVVGQLDDLLLVSTGLFLTARLVPENVLAECRRRAGHVTGSRHPIRWTGAGLVVAARIAVLVLAARLVIHALAP
jgi:uncharacterized membrane protein YkvA (DUF1232 family)